MRSDPLTKGINAAPQRSLLKALGLCDAEIGKPLIGVKGDRRFCNACAIRRRKAYQKQYRENRKKR